MNSKHPSNQDLHASTLECINAGRFEQARQQCQQLCRSNPHDAVAWFLLAGISAQLGDLAGVTESCRKVIALQPGNAAAHYNLAVALQTQGKNAEAERHYRAVLQTTPDHLASLSNLGLALRAQGRPSEALRVLGDVLRSRPDATDALNSLGLCHRDLHQYEQAAECFNKILSIDPASAQALSNLGLCLLDQTRTDAAIEVLRKALQLAPDFTDALTGLTTALTRSGKSQEAVALLQQALSRQPANAQLHFTLGNALNAAGNPQAAVTSFQSAIRIDPSHYEARNNLASLLQAAGRLQQAEEAYRAAVQVRPDQAGIHYNLSLVLFEQGRFAEALRSCHTALQLRPDEATFRQHFMKLIAGCPQEALDKVYADEILRCFAAVGVDYQYLAGPALARLRAHKLFQRLEQLTARNGAGAIQDGVRKREFTPLSNDPLLRGLLTHTVICDTPAELALTALRKALLLMVVERWREPADAETDFIAAMACQCANNEFAYYLDPQERALVDALQQSVDAALGAAAGDIASRQRDIAALAMYRPLSGLEHNAALHAVAPAWLPTVRLMIERQLTHWQTEQALRARMPHLTAIQDGVSGLVKDQYEENPYPRWLGVHLLKPQPYAQVFRGMFPHFDPPAFGDGKLDVLIAGCGTGKHAILSKTRFADSVHLAVDLSTASLAYARRKADEYGLTDLRFMQADILELGGIEQRFHIIESVGVLHHMADPGAGLKVLTGLLRPGGLMNIGLYSTLARRSIAAARALYGDRISTLNADTLRELRRQIIDLPPGNPISKVRQTSDFYSLSDCRDLLFHVHEHCFSLPQIAALLERNNLRFIGFELQAPSTKQLYKAANPGDRNLTDLALWDRFEHAHPDTFAGMYVFWCQKQ